jgi:hypothetical protein
MKACLPCFLIASALELFAAVADPALAQRNDAELTGNVVSTATGQPVTGAWIALRGWEFGTYSRRDGRFRLPEIPGGPRPYDVQALGYLPTTLTLDPRSGDLVIELEPDEELQAGVAFLFRHLDARRRGGRVFDVEDLAFSGSFDLAEFMTTRGVRSVRRFCVDERWSPGASQAPPGNFYRMELHGGTARLYTEEFLARTAAEPPETIREIIRRDMPVC